MKRDFSADTASEHRDPPLHIALVAHQTRRLSQVNALLKAGADPRARDCDKGIPDRTPLHILATYGGMTADLWLRLLDAGADLNARDRWGRTPAQELEKWGGIDKGVDPAVLTLLAAHGLRDELVATPPLRATQAERSRL